MKYYSFIYDLYVLDNSSHNFNKKQVTQGKNLTSYSVPSAKQVNMHMPSEAMKLVWHPVFSAS